MKKTLLVLTLLLISGAAGAQTWTHVTAGSGQNADFATSLSVTGLTIARGSLIVVGCVISSVHGKTMTVSDNSSGGTVDSYSIVIPQATNATNGLAGEMIAWAATVTATSPPTSVNCNLGSGNQWFWMAVDNYTGAANPFVEDGSPVAFTKNTSGSPAASLTTTPANDLLWSLEGVSNCNQGTTTVASPFTLRQTSASGYGKTSDSGVSSGLASSTAYTATYTQGTACAWGVGVVAFQAVTLAAIPALMTLGVGN